METYLHSPYALVTWCVVKTQGQLHLYHLKIKLRMLQETALMYVFLHNSLKYLLTVIANFWPAD